MRASELTASVALVLALVASTTYAQSLDEILSFARESGYWNEDVEPRRTVRSYSGAPGGEALVEMDYLQLRRVARASSADFDRWLRGIPAGEFWRKHFDSRSIQEHLASDVNAAPTADERQATAQFVGMFDRAVANADLDDITRISSARTLRAALRELATPPDRRLLRQLSLSARRLNRSLGNLNTGVTWQRYLALPDGVIAAADRPPGDAELRPDVDPKELGQILERYDRVSARPEFRAIASLPEFETTYKRLTDFVKPPSNTPPERPTTVAEELPPPELQIR